MCSPGRRAKESPPFAESNGHTNHTRFMHDSYPNHVPPHTPHPGCFGGACGGPGVKRVVSLVGLGVGVFGRRVHLRVCPATHGAEAGPLLKVQLIQQYNFKAANHTLESYTESCPRIKPPIQIPRPDYGKKTHPCSTASRKEEVYLAG